MKLVLFLDPNDGLILYSVDEKGNKEYCESMEDFYNVVNYLDRAGYKIIKDGRNLILKNSSKKFMMRIVNYERVLKDEDVAELKKSIDKYYQRDGAIDRTNSKNISHNKTHNSKHANKFLKRVACLAVVGTMIVGGVLIGNNIKSHNELTPAEYYTEINQPQQPMQIQDIGEEAFTQAEDVSEEAFTQDEDVSLESEGSVDLIDISNYAELDFENNSDTEKAIECKNNYYDLICEIAPKYGLDPDMMLAIATQERGEHSTTIDDGGGIGLMQIQYNVWANQDMYYDILGDDGQFHSKKVTVTDSMMRDLRTNVELACGVMQNCLDACANNPAMAIYMYNHGYGSFHELFVAYCSENGLDRGDTCRDYSNLDWYSFMKDRIDSGDPVYLQKVLQWCDEPTFQIMDRATGEQTDFSFIRNENVRK